MTIKKPDTSKSFQSPTAFDEKRVGAAAVYCSDGRFGDQMDEFVHQEPGIRRNARFAPRSLALGPGL